MQASADGAAASSNCASQPSCAHTGFLRVNGRWNFNRLHFLQANWLGKALNSSQRAFSSPIEPSPQDPVLEMAAEILDFALHQTVEKPVVDARHQRRRQLSIIEQASERRG